MTSSQIAIFDGNVTVPAHIQSRMAVRSALTDAIATSNASPVNRISTRASRFRLIIGGEEKVWDKLELPVTIVGARSGVAKTFYAEAFTGEDNVSPDCWSFDGVAPHTSVIEPKCKNCSMCPLNRFGSKITPQGKETKACSDSKRLAVVLPDTPMAGVFLLNVSATALKPMNQYVNELRKRNIPIECIRTVIYFDPNVSYPRLLFKFGGFLTEEEQQRVDVFLKSDETNRIIGVDTDHTIVDEPTEPTEPVVIQAEPAVETVEEVKPAPKAAPKTTSKAAPKPAAEKAVQGTPVKVKAENEDVTVVDANTADLLASKLDALFAS